MKDFPSLKEYLRKHADDNTSIDSLKKEYIRLYHKEYNKRRKLDKNKLKRLTLRLSQKEYNFIKEQMTKYSDRSINRFVVESFINYHKQEYLDHHPDLTQTAINAILQNRQIVSNVVNKLNLEIFRSKSSRVDFDFSIETLYKLVGYYEQLDTAYQKLHAEMKQFLSSPPPQIIKLSWSELKASSEKRNSLIQYLQEFE